ncbi:MAG: HAD-IA family hydrolase [Gammaproteobacteria bacterium]|nr:HAD-IA family hydrolase [Gammaproteobacteria bacterium]
MIKGILFDKDGTLLDFNRSWLAPYLQASEYLASSIGRPELASELMAKGGYIAESNSWIQDSLLASGSNRQILDFWSKEIGQPLEGERLDMVYAIFAHASNAYVPVLEDLGGFLQQLRDRGIKLGLATMDDESNAYGMLDKLSLGGLFDFVCGANSGYGVKPEPGMIMAFCDQCQLTATEVMMVGDSPRDLVMGKNAGAALSVGVLTGAHDRVQLEGFGDLVLNDISGLISVLDRNG